MVVGFQLYPDDEDVTLQGSGAALAETSRGQIVYSPPIRSLLASDGVTVVNAVDQQRISSLIVGLVAVDAESMKLLDRTQTEALASAFTLPASGAPVAVWNSLTEDIMNLPSSVPLPARQSVRVFQRAFPVRPYGGNGL
jgi:hypothetical protein